MWEDLEAFILQRQRAGKLIVLMIDANSNFNYREMPMNQLKILCNLKDAHSHFHKATPEPTFACRNKKIDYILVSDTIISLGTLMQAGTLPLHEEIISNYTLLFIDLDEKHLLQAISSKIMSPQHQILCSTNKKARKVYKKELLKQLKAKRILCMWQHFTKNASIHPACIPLGQARKYDGIEEAFNDAAIYAEKNVGRLDSVEMLS